MAPRPKWWYTMHEARRQACIAIDFYNRAGEKQSLSDFVVHMHLAWQNLLHADLERRGVNIFFKEKNGRYKRDKDGGKLSWDLSTCVKREFKDNDPIRANIEFFVGLRNMIEHRFQKSLMVATASHAHALVLNFERELVDRFGDEESLAEELRFPIFVQSLTPAGVEEQRKLRRNVPSEARAFITRFESSLAVQTREDSRFEYRVLLTPIKGTKTDSDLAFTFVNTNTLTSEQIAELATGEKANMVLVAEKPRSVGLVDELLPADAARAIQARIPYKFGIHSFTRLRQSQGVGPPKGGRKDSGDGVLCIYSAPTRQHVYTPAFINRCVNELATAEGYERALGVAPVLK